MFHAALNHTGTVATSPTKGTVPVWTYTTGNGIGPSSPAIANGRVYIGSNDNKTYCFNTTTGAKIWSYTTGGNIYSSPAVAGGRVYVGSNDFKLYCFNATTGVKLWSNTTGQYVGDAPAVSAGRVYVGSMDNKTYCFNATTGTKIWTYTTGYFIGLASPAVFSGQVYIGSCDNKVYCLNATNGSRIWSYLAGSWINTSPAIAGGRLFVGCLDDKVYCLNATNGTKIWSYTTNNPIDSSPAVANGYVYVGSGDYKIYCLNSTTGKEVWNYTTSNLVNTSPAISAGLVYIGSYDHRLYCLNATTGKLVWSYLTGSQMISSPAIASGKVYVGGYDGIFYCFPMIMIPSTPRNFQATARNSQVILTWQPPLTNAGSAIMGYKIYRGTTAGGEMLHVTTGNVTTYNDTGLMNGQVYYYKISAVNGVGEGVLSTEVYAIPLTTPSQPRNFNATAGSGQVLLSWEAPSDNGGSPITGYKVYRATVTGGETFLAILGNVTTYLDKNVVGGQVYYYKIVAINTAGDGLQSNETSVTPAASTTPSPTPSFWDLFGSVILILTPTLLAIAIITSIGIARKKSRRKKL